MPADTLTFTAWPDPHDPYNRPVDDLVSKHLWLPLIGPSAWLIWGTLARQLHHQLTVQWDLAELAHAHGLGTGNGASGPVRRTLRRLHGFRLLTSETTDHHLVRLTAPPLRPRQLDKLPPHLVELHQRTYQPPLRNAG